MPSNTNWGDSRHYRFPNGSDVTIIASVGKSGWQFWYRVNIFGTGGSIPNENTAQSEKSAVKNAKAVFKAACDVMESIGGIEEGRL